MSDYKCPISLESFNLYPQGALYRGRRKRFSDWVEGYFIRDDSGTACIVKKADRPSNIPFAMKLDFAFVEASSVGRCSGIKDNCEKMMFEGDIIRMNGNRKDLAVVEFGEFACVSIDPEEKVDTVIGWHYRPLPTDELSQIEPFCWEFQLNSMWVKNNDIRVIGNIHDNPELLGEVK